MTVTRPHGLAAIRETFGDPRPFANDKGGWERHALAYRPLRTPLPYAYDRDVVITRVRAHRLIVDELVAALAECLDAGVPAARLVYGGCYVWRPMRGGTKLSTHTWGIAVDLDPANNPQGTAWRDDGVMLDRRIIETFLRRGWKSGDDFSTPDPQHFQFASGY